MACKWPIGINNFLTSILDIVDDPMFEVMRICELPKVYSQCHDKPFQMPFKVQEALREHKQGQDSGSNTEVRI